MTRALREVATAVVGNVETDVEIFRRRKAAAVWTRRSQLEKAGFHEGRRTAVQGAPYPIVAVEGGVGEVDYRTVVVDSAAVVSAVESKGRVGYLDRGAIGEDSTAVVIARIVGEEAVINLQIVALSINGAAAIALVTVGDGQVVKNEGVVLGVKHPHTRSTDYDAGSSRRTLDLENRVGNGQQYVNRNRASDREFNGVVSGSRRAIARGSCRVTVGRRDCVMQGAVT